MQPIIKEIIGKLPKLKPRILSKDRLDYQKGICEGRVQMHTEVIKVLEEYGKNMEDKKLEIRWCHNIGSMK